MKVTISSLRLTTRMGARVLVAKLQHLQRDRVSTLKMIQMLSQGDAYWSTAIPTSRSGNIDERRLVHTNLKEFSGTTPSATVATKVGGRN
jgi:hypothetical protein